MNIFKSRLRKRIESLENHLGVFYVKDVYGDHEHKEEKDVGRWTVSGQLQEIKKQLEGKKK